MRLRPGFAIFLGSKLAGAAREYKSSLRQYDSAVSCISVDTADEAHLARVFGNAVGLLDARSIRRLIDQGLLPDDNLGQISAFFFVDSDEIDLLATTLKAFVVALDRISFDVTRLHFVTVVAGPADREGAKPSCCKVHKVFSSVLGDGGVQTAVLVLLPWFDGAPIQNRADLYRLVGFVGQLCSLSEGDPRQSEFSQFKNAHFIGKTYIAGLRSYATGNVDGAVHSCVLSAAWKQIGALFRGQDIPSRRVLGDLIRRYFPLSMCAPELEDDPLGQLFLERARTEYLPGFVSELASRCRNYSEFRELIRLIAKETMEATNRGAAGTVVASIFIIWTSAISNWLLGIGVGIAIIIAVVMISRRRGASQVENSQPPPVEMPGSLPTNRLLHRVVEEFSASLPTEVANAPRLSHRLGTLDLLPFQECYDPAESKSGQLTADNQLVTVAADVVASLFVLTKHSEWIPASTVEVLRAGLGRCQSAVESAIYGDFTSWVREKQKVAGTEQHRWLFSQRIPITDIRCFEFRPEAMASDCSEASLVQCSANFLYLVPTQWN